MRLWDVIVSTPFSYVAVMSSRFSHPLRNR
jgi:hypothetical protein